MTTQSSSASAAGYVSLRWRFFTPLFLIVLVLTVIGGYLLGRSIASGLRVSQENLILTTAQSVRDALAVHYDVHLTEAGRVAVTVGVSDAVESRDAAALAPILDAYLKLNRLDAMIVTDARGEEIVGLTRQADNTFVTSSGAFLGAQPVMMDALNGERGSTGLLNTSRGTLLVTSVPVQRDGAVIGGVLVGQSLDTFLDDLRDSAVVDLMLYGPDAALLQTTLAEAADAAMLLDDALFEQALLADEALPVRPLALSEQDYQVAYQPLRFGPVRLGVIGVLMPDDAPFITEMGRQLTALFTGALAGAILIVGYLGVNRVTQRAEGLARTADALARGEAEARTGMAASDEVGVAAEALDRYADRVHQREDRYQRVLRRQRREINHLLLILETMPEGVVLQGMDGRVLMINEAARELLGSRRVFRSENLHQLVETVQDKLGGAIVPGLHAVGDPSRLMLGGRVLSAQVATINTSIGRQIGTVVLLKDISAQVRRTQEQERLLQEIALGIQAPLAEMGRRMQTGVSEGGQMQQFARDLSRHAVALQKVMVSLQELSLTDDVQVQRRQRVISLDTLVWSVANEWRQVAVAGDLTLHVMIAEAGLFVLGDEKRLRWALGNVIDNAIKYTQAGGALTLEVQGSRDGMALLRVRDNGVGIVPDDLPLVFTPFWRGRPTAPDGTRIRVPGMGQGLAVMRSIIQAHGGGVQLKSSAGIGTAVYVQLPLTSPQQIHLPLVHNLEGETVRVHLPGSSTLVNGQ